MTARWSLYRVSAIAIYCCFEPKMGLSANSVMIFGRPHHMIGSNNTYQMPFLAELEVEIQIAFDVNQRLARLEGETAIVREQLARLRRKPYQTASALIAEYLALCKQDNC